MSPCISVLFLKKIISFIYFCHINVVPFTYVCSLSVYLVPVEAGKGIRSLEQVLQTVVSHCEGAGNKTQVL